MKQNKRPRSLDVVKQKCVLAVNTGGRRLCKQARFLWLSWSRGGQFVVRLFRFASPRPPHTATPARLQTQLWSALVGSAAGGEELITALHEAKEKRKRAHSPHDGTRMSAVAQASVEDLSDNKHLQSLHLQKYLLGKCQRVSRRPLLKEKFNQK